MLPDLVDLPNARLARLELANCFQQLLLQETDAQLEIEAGRLTMHLQIHGGSPKLPKIDMNLAQRLGGRPDAAVADALKTRRRLLAQSLCFGEQFLRVRSIMYAQRGIRVPMAGIRVNGRIQTGK
jgi:hypothetical protein